MPNCEFAVGDLLPGYGPIGMQTPNITSPPLPNDCVLSGVPLQATGCQSFKVTVTMNAPKAGSIIVANAGQINDGVTRYSPTCHSTGYVRSNVTTYTWIAPAQGGNVSLKALCGKKGGVYLTATQYVQVSASAQACPKLGSFADRVLSGSWMLFFTWFVTIWMMTA